MQNMNAKFKATKPKVIIGKRQGKKLQSTVRTKFINLFISRLNPSTTEVHMQESIVDAFVNNYGTY